LYKLAESTNASRNHNHVSVRNHRHNGEISRYVSEGVEMEKSESIKLLAGALAQAQAEMPAVQFNATNPFLKNKYADLGAIISTSKPILGKNGLSVSQLVSTDNGNVGVTTVLMHNSGEWLESTAWLSLGEEKGKSQAQVAGSIITYLRRYSLASILGMYADEDGDGNPAPKSEQKQQAKPQQSNNPVIPDTSLVQAAVELGGQVTETTDESHDWENMAIGELVGRLNEYTKRLKKNPKDEDTLKKFNDAKFWLEKKNAK